MQLSGQTVLVTGGGSGLGEATARHVANRGANVALLDFDFKKAKAVAQDVGGIAVRADVSDANAVEAGFAEVIENFGAPPRIVVNCAGIAPAARIVGRGGELSLDVFERTLRVNLVGTFTVMSHAVRHMLELEPLEGGERGVIVNTASIAGEDGQLGQTAYSASKGAIASMCLPAARELAQHAIRIVAIAPGLFNTPMMQALPADVSEKIAANIPFPSRLGEPLEYALLVEQVVSNPFLNGTTIRLDGAVRLPPR